MDDLALLGRLALAALLGGVIGFEREQSGKPAGLRTNLLICVGAALITELSRTIAFSWAGTSRPADPSRIAAQIVSGVGFIGAGTIIQARGNVHGLTTAATMWVVAAIGMAVGSADYIRALGATVIVVIALQLLGRIEKMMGSDLLAHTLAVELNKDPTLLSALSDRLDEAGLPTTELDVHVHEDQISVRFRGRAEEHVWTAVTRSLLEQEGVRRVSLR